MVRPGWGQGAQRRKHRHFAKLASALDVHDPDVSVVFAPHEIEVLPVGGEVLEEQTAAAAQVRQPRGPPIRQ